MSVPESRNFPAEEGITEVELSAEEFQSLVRPPASATPVPRRQPALAAPRNAPLVEKLVQAARSGARAWQLPAVVAAASVTALAGVGYLYAFAGKHVPTPPAVAVTYEISDLQPIEASVKKAVLPGRPVRIKNPFDKREVFEFPPGTPKAQAREAVAKLLMERAMERRALYTSTPSRPRSRKPG